MGSIGLMFASSNDILFHYAQPSKDRREREYYLQTWVSKEGIESAFLDSDRNLEVCLMDGVTELGCGVYVLARIL